MTKSVKKMLRGYQSSSNPPSFMDGIVDIVPKKANLRAVRIAIRPSSNTRGSDSAKRYLLMWSAVMMTIAIHLVSSKAPPGIMNGTWRVRGEDDIVFSSFLGRKRSEDMGGDVWTELNRRRIVTEGSIFKVIRATSILILGEHSVLVVVVNEDIESFEFKER
ncbi:hypothetical protein TWF481_011688 [Arthrobotrys musiformis]|uniref:Uncharacterized protein n=1 Tax=Arthrobotrys musiformis TaxID=47236 RepID=A0AAV9VZA1_9PEZI